MSCDKNRHRFLARLAPQIEEHFSLGEAEAFSLLEASFQRASLPPNLPPQAVAAARLAAAADCKALFEEAATQGIALGHRGLPKNSQKVLGYSTLWRIERAIREPQLQMPEITTALAREKYHREHCPTCGRFYNPVVGCSHNTPQTQGEVQSQTQRPIPPQPPKDAKLPFFVYGTLRTGQGNWQRLLKGKTSAEAPATLPGAKMYSRGIAYVFDALASEPSSQVVGNLVWLPGDEQAYAGVRVSLDRLEGYSSNLDDGLYRRVAREVEYTDEAGERKTVLAWVYQGGDSVRANLTDKERVTGGDWLASQKHFFSSLSEPALASETSSPPQTSDTGNANDAEEEDDEDDDDDEYYYANGLDYLLEEDEEEEDIREWDLPHELELEDDSTRFYGDPDDKYAPWDATEDRDAVAENTLATKPATSPTPKAKAQPSKLKPHQKPEKEKKERAEPQTVYYFAFGSNMSESRMRQRGVRYTARFAATLAGYRLEFNKKSGIAGKGFANIVPDSKGKVVGVVYETNPAGIAALDRFEGVPAHYYRETVSIQAGSRGSISAIAYIAQPNMCEDGLKPTKEYLEHLLDGQDLLPPEYYQKLKRQKTIAEPARPSYGFSSATPSTLSNRPYSSSSGSGFSSNKDKDKESSYYSSTLWGSPSDGYSSSYSGGNSSSSSYRAAYKSSESFKSARFNDALRDLLSKLDLDDEVSYGLEEVLYTLAQRQGVSERQLFKIALLRAFTDLIEEQKRK